MSNEHILIHDFDFNLIGDFFKDLDRQGPGSPEVTRQALQFVGNLSENARIADIGCGTGGQTMTLAGLTPGHITAIDLMPAFVETFRRKVVEKSLQDRITVLEGSMMELPFRKEEFDLIWSEGAISHIGFERGMREFHQYLKPGGFIAASEATWFTDGRPDEIATFWEENYPEIDTVPNKVAQMQAAGYVPVAHFILPESTWWNYFNPQRALYDDFLQRHNHSAAAKGLISQFEHETALYKKYSVYYGYAFYIGQKIG